MLSLYLNLLRSKSIYLFVVILFLTSCKEDEEKFVAPEVDVKSEDIDGETYSMDETFNLEFNVFPTNGVTVKNLDLRYLKYVDESFGYFLKQESVEINSNEPFSQQLNFNFSDYEDELSSGDKLQIEVYMYYVGRPDQTMIFNFILNIE